MNVLALCSYPLEAAATRYRLLQFVAPLAARDIHLSVRPFLSSRLFAALYRKSHLHRTAAGLMGAAFARLGDVWRAGKADVLLVQREAMMFGPPLIEWLIARGRRIPFVLDLDDATYISYVSPTYGRLGSALKWFRKTNDLIAWADVVTCGNRAIADYVASKGRRAIVIPTVVETNRFQPAPEKHDDDDDAAPILGWIGTHSTYPYLAAIFPALQQLARTHRFRLKVIGAGRDADALTGVATEYLAWNLAREIEDFQSFDIGLYPLAADDWAAGKSGFKAIQYMAVGIPYVATPRGATTEIGEAGTTHFLADSQDEWREALALLLTDRDLRRKMGRKGRLYALEHYTVAAQADKLAQALGEAYAARAR